MTKVKMSGIKLLDKFKYKKIINDSYDQVLSLIWGGKNINVMLDFLTALRLVNLKSIEIIPYDQSINGPNPECDGLAIAYSKKDYKILIKGVKSLDKNSIKKISIEMFHEFFHICQFALANNTIKCTELTDESGVSQNLHYNIYQIPNDGTTPYCTGITLSEIFTELIVTFSVENYSKENSFSFNYFLKNNYNLENSTYDYLLTLIKLMLSAMSNDPYINYDETIKRGEGIFDQQTQMNNGTILYSNDLMYGMLFNCLHVKVTYDKIMGKGEYEKLTSKVEQVLSVIMEKRYIDPWIIKSIILDLQKFLNLKCKFYMFKGYMNYEQAKDIIINFYKMLDIAKIEYRVYFTLEEITNFFQNGDTVSMETLEEIDSREIKLTTIDNQEFYNGFQFPEHTGVLNKLAKKDPLDKTQTFDFPTDNLSIESVNQVLKNEEGYQRVRKTNNNKKD